MKLGAYELLERIAVGGMAEVFRGRAVGEGGFEKQVAIKRILPHLARDERFVGMLVQEARIHAGLSHRNIVQIHDLGLSEEGEYFIVLEYVDGRDMAVVLQSMTERPRPLRVSDAVALHVLIELAQGVHCAHELAGGDGQVAGLVHRDISPSNVLLSYAGEVKLSDFGLAKRQSDQSVVGSLKGKLAYMSPEQARRWPLDRRSDIFALGAVLFELLTGRRLREIEDEVEGWRLVASGVMSSPAALRPDLPPVLERLLNRALAPDPKDRFADAAAFATAAKQALAQVPRPASGEAAELQALLRGVLPPGSPRPASAPSRVIRLQSQFFAPSSASADMATTRPGVTGVPKRRNTPPPPPLAMASPIFKAVGAGPSPVRDAGATAMPSAPSRPAAPSTPPSGQASITAFPRGMTVTSFTPTSLRRRRSPPPERVPADELMPVSGELALPERQDKPAPAASLDLRLPGVTAELAAVSPGMDVGRAGAPGADPSSSRSTPPRSTPVRATPARPARATAATHDPAWAQAPATLEAASFYRTPRAAALALGTPGLDPAAITPRLAPAFTHPRPRKRVWPFALGAGCAVALAVHVFMVPLPVLVRWGTPAKLIVQSEPQGADVWLDGQKLATTTPTFVQVPRDRRAHELRFSKEGFIPISHLMRFDRQVRLTVNAALTASPTASSDDAGGAALGADGPALQPDELPRAQEALEETAGDGDDPLAPSAAAAVMNDTSQHRARAPRKRRQSHESHEGRDDVR